MTMDMEPVLVSEDELRKQSFHKLLEEKDGKDWELRLIFADWLADHGYEVEANGQQWQAKHKRRPFDSYADDKKRWSWCNSRRPETVWSGLYEPMYSRLRETDNDGLQDDSVWYTTSERAEKMLATALWELGIRSE